MGIDEISIQNFTVFEDVKMHFSNGINVIIGENGTGKTHLLKLLYAFCQSNTAKAAFVGMEPMLSQSMYIALDRYFMNPQAVDWARERTKPCAFSCTIDKQSYAISLHVSEQFDGARIYKTEYKKQVNPSVFIPAKEMLTHAGIEKDYTHRALPLDATLIDIINFSGVSVQRYLPETHKRILNRLSGIIRGKVLFENDAYYIVRDNKKICFSLEAEGNKKFALLYRLIETAVLDRGAILFWDEPEANINPKLIPDLVDILYELEEIGVQIFLASHSYIFAKYFEVKRRKASQVMFHSLYFPSGQNSVAWEHNQNFRDLKENSIVWAFDVLLDEVFERNMGD